MGVTVAVTRVACNTSTGTQTITTTDMGGLTPKAALFFLSVAVSDGTAADHSLFMVGATTGSGEGWAHNSKDEHNQASSDSAEVGSRSACVYMMDDTETIVADADFSAWASNGITINWVIAPGSAYLLTVILFGGTDLTAIATSTQLNNSVDSANDITDVGFEADLVFVNCNRNVADESVSNVAYNNFGIVHNDRAGTITQRAISKTDRWNRSNGEPVVYSRSDAGIITANSGGSLDWYGEFGSFDSSGFTVTVRNAGANNQYINYLALRFGATPAVDGWVGTYTSPTATGNDSESGPGFEPQFVLMFLSGVEAVSTVYTDGRAWLVWCWRFHGDGRVHDGGHK